MELHKFTSATNNEKLHKLFYEYYQELDKVVRGLSQKSMTDKEIKNSFKIVDRKKVQIKSFKKR